MDHNRLFYHFVHSLQSLRIFSIVLAFIQLHLCGMSVAVATKANLASEIFIFAMVLES